VAPTSTDQLSARVQALAELAPLRELLGHPRHGPALPDTYLVGGSVRDLLLDRRPFDIDLATDGEPAGLAALLGAPSEETRFGTVSVRGGDVRYDIARTRSERYPHPGALPEVEPAPIEADLLRRDFTVNAIAFGLLGSRAGDIVSAPGALDDLARRRLAVLHEHSFLDDPTRLLRLARYAARLDFAVAPPTRELAADAISGGALVTVSPARIGNELRLLAAEPDPVAAFSAVADLGLPWTIDPALTRSALSTLPADGRGDLLVLAVALSGSLDQLDELGFTAADRDAIAQAATQAPALASRLRQAGTRSEIASAVGPAGIETVALASAQGARDQSLTWLNELRHLRPDITGADLLAAGVPEGPAVGRGLTAAHEALLDGTAPDRASQLEVALKSAR
jgi:tRNA nucleotidyltransferase (CCA-adding enzyme)